ncbi:MAG: hypothetical protein K5883_03460 [Pseudobutyrivibrio sp.]|nr:hypothetical protein [Pseudobutyrivibrio sp.]
MFNLIKYELRKTLGLKFIILIMFAIFQVTYLIGLYGELDTPLVFGTMGLTFGSFVAIILIGVYSIRLLRKDLNTKQSYMLFMTPNNSYKILGAKVIENGISIIVASLFVILLGILDISLLTTKYSEFGDLIAFINQALGDLQQINTASIVSTVCVMIAEWLYIVGTGFFAIVIIATLLNGRKHNGIAGLGIFFLITFIVRFVINKTVSRSYDINISLAHNLTLIAIYIVLAIVMYFVTAWIMDNKLSV